MRNIKTITRNIKFVPISGIDFYEDFFNADGKIETESVIESVYCNNILKATSGKVDAIKKCFKRGTTDGLLRFRYEGNIIEFYGIQECKRNIKRNSAAYKYQVIQALLYYIQLSECKVLIINSANYFDYIIIDENKEFLNNIQDRLSDLLCIGSPSTVCKNCPINIINNLKIHTCDVPDEIKINNIMLNIYRKCV